ncbi:MAG: STAS domain-containing protein [Acidobacteriota bacterium]
MMDMYQHDGATTFRFVLRGELSGKAVEELEQAWQTAQSVARGKEFVVDISGVTATGAAGAALLVRLREMGARVLGEPVYSDTCSDRLHAWSRPRRR